MRVRRILKKSKVKQNRERNEWGKTNKGKKSLINLPTKRKSFTIPHTLTNCVNVIITIKCLNWWLVIFVNYIKNRCRVIPIGLAPLCTECGLIAPPACATFVWRGVNCYQFVSLHNVCQSCCNCNERSIKQKSTIFICMAEPWKFAHTVTLISQHKVSPCNVKVCWTINESVCAINMKFIHYILILHFFQYLAF